MGFSLRSALVFACLVLVAHIHKTAATVDCSTADNCKTLKFTSGTCSADTATCACDDDSCECAAGYALITKQCKLKTPTVSVPTGRAPSVVSGKSATLTCTVATDIPSADITGYVWKSGGTAVPDQTEKTYTLANVNANTNIICGLKGSNDLLASADSNQLTLTELKSGVTFAGTLTNVAIVETKDNGTFTPSCTGLPIGQDPVYKDESDNIIATVALPYPRTDKSQYSCAIPDDVKYTVTNKKSALINYPAEGKYCANDDACTGTGYENTCTNSRCVCSTGYNATLTICRDNKAAGQVCVSDNYCTKSDSLTGSCANNVCACNKNFYTEESGCSAFGKKCTTDNASTNCKGNNYSGKCGDNSRCVCKNGHSVTKEGCADGASAIAASVFLLVAALFTSRLF